MATGNPLPARIYLGTTAVTAGAGAVAAGTPRVTLASDDPGVTHLATIAGDTTDIETAVELIDDCVVADDAAFTPATTKVMMAGFEFDDAAPDSVNEGDAGAARMSARREVYVQIRDAAGNERGLNVDASGFIGVTDGAGSLTVDNGGTFAVQATVAAAATSIAKAEDAAHTTADVGVPALAVRRDSAAVGSDTDGDYSTLNVNSSGRLYTSATVDAALPAGTNAIGKLAANSGVDIGDTDVTSVIPGTGATNLGKAEDAAHSSGDTGVMALTVRQDTAAALGQTDGDYQPPITDSTGRLWCNVSNTVTVASHAVTNAGTFAVQESGAALTALQLIDNLVLAEDAAHVSGDPGVQALSVRKDTAAAVGQTDGDYQPLITDANGRLHVLDANSAAIAASLSVLDDWDSSDRCSVSPISGQAGVAGGAGATGATVQRVVQANDAGKTILSKAGTAASSGNNTLVTAGTNRLKVSAFSLSTTSSTAVTCIFQDGASGTALWQVILQAGTGTSTGANLAVPFPSWLFATSAATLLNLNLSGAITVHYSLTYVDEA